MLEYYPNLFELQFLLCFGLGYGTHTTPQQYASKPWKDLPSTLCLPRVGSGGDFQVPSHRCSELYQSGFCLCLDYSDRCLIPEYGLSDSFDFIHLRSGWISTLHRLWDSSLGPAFCFSLEKVQASWRILLISLQLFISQAHIPVSRCYVMFYSVEIDLCTIKPMLTPTPV